MLGSQKDAGTGCCRDVQRFEVSPIAEAGLSGALFPLGLSVHKWTSLVPLGKVTPSAVAWKERVICRNTMVLNRCLVRPANR